MIELKTVLTIVATLAVMAASNALASRKPKRRAAVAESLLMQFISSAEPVPEREVHQVLITDEMMKNLRMWQRAKHANFKGAAAGVLKGFG